MIITPIIFMSSPFAGQGSIPETRKRDQERNVEFAKTVCRDIALKTGAMPVAPHLLFPQFLNDHDEFERGLGIAYCNTLLHSSRYAVFVLPEWRSEFSAGMKAERNAAEELGILHRRVRVDEHEREAYTDLLDKLALMFPVR